MADQHLDRKSVTGAILLVEDDKLVRELMTVLLQQAGHRIFAYGSPEEALAFARTAPLQLHLAIVDVVLPEWSGPEFAARLLAIHPEIPLLFMSGFFDAGALAAEPGLHFLEKPIGKDDLLAAVHRAMTSERCLAGAGA